jgi:hypothetical protein
MDYLSRLEALPDDGLDQLSKSLNRYGFAVIFAAYRTFADFIIALDDRA